MKRFRLQSAALALDNIHEKTAMERIPAGAIINIFGDSSETMTRVIYEGKSYWMFIRDIEDRAEEV